VKPLDDAAIFDREKKSVKVPPVFWKVETLKQNARKVESQKPMQMKNV